MALIILEGLDRTGKSTVAEQYKAKGFELIHQSAPPKGQTADLFVEEQIQLVAKAAGKDIVLDRSYYGELVWPQVYSRPTLLTPEALEALREMETSVGTTRILMHDPNAEVHWKRCVDNKEPMTRTQFALARKLFNEMAETHGFVRQTLQDFVGSVLPQQDPKPVEIAPIKPRGDEPPTFSKFALPDPTREQDKLARANAINGILSKRLIKAKGPLYDQLEHDLRSYLNNELAKIFGTTEVSNAFSAEEVDLLKFFCGKLKEGKR